MRYDYRHDVAGEIAAARQTAEDESLPSLWVAVSAATRILRALPPASASDRSHLLVLSLLMSLSLFALLFWRLLPL